LLAVSGGTLAVIARLPAIRGTPTFPSAGATLSRRGAVSGGPLTVLGPPPRDPPARVIHYRSVVCRQLIITFGANLIALGSRSIATVSTRVTTGGRASTPRDGPAAFARVAFACVAHEVMQATVATCLEIAIA